MADETYRKFHSGRFGQDAEPIKIEYETKISGSKGVSGGSGKKDTTAKDDAGNTYKDQETADMFSGMTKFMGSMGGG